MITIKRILLVTLISFLTKGVNAQKLTVEYVNNWIKSIDTTFVPDEQYDIYIVNGVLIEKEVLETELSEYDLSQDKISIDYLDRKEIAKVFNPRPGVFISIISNNWQLKKKSIRKYLMEFRERIPEPTIKTNHINLELKQPVLFLNGVDIPHNEAGKVLANLRAKEIFNMSYSNKAPIQYYGKNAKNGLIQIWLKKRFSD
ncbi:hypothetical protein BFP97_03670 [Roseivirga sp. 4D4]|uniref:hypothetical protein n=1 Tax=Roseivirga sp. 4D4 TaxID=1889784 RepID=UPI0008535161|nr:hypothetical protein [Roseivirga sp. 4D4]OEK00659.1 hypothetical protein BFP97_03670 [Roseivirga sp. 4D4]